MPLRQIVVSQGLLPSDLSYVVLVMKEKPLVAVAKTPASRDGWVRIWVMEWGSFRMTCSGQPQAHVKSDNCRNGVG